jgi:hypothetical protein
MDQMGWLDPARVFQTTPTGSSFPDVALAPMNEPRLQGYLAARVDPYFIEFRTRNNWDRGWWGSERRRVDYDGRLCVR